MIIKKTSDVFKKYLRTNLITIFRTIYILLNKKKLYLTTKNYFMFYVFMR